MKVQYKTFQCQDFALAGLSNGKRNNTIKDAPINKIPSVFPGVTLKIV
jgi:hypothetical protein